MSLRNLRVLALLTATVAIGSCGLSFAHGGSMNQDQVLARSKSLVADMLKAAAPDVSTQIDQDSANGVGPCPPPATGKVAARYTEILPSLPASRYQQIAAATKKFWQKQGFQVVTQDSPQHTPRVFARTGDGFDLTYAVVSDGSSFISADSPCVSASGSS